MRLTPFPRRVLQNCGSRQVSRQGLDCDESPGKAWTVVFPGAQQREVSPEQAAEQRLEGVESAGPGTAQKCSEWQNHRQQSGGSEDVGVCQCDWGGPGPSEWPEMPQGHHPPQEGWMPWCQQAPGSSLCLTLQEWNLLFPVHNSSCTFSVHCSCEWALKFYFLFLL